MLFTFSEWTSNTLDTRRQFTYYFDWEKVQHSMWDTCLWLHLDWLVQP